MHSRENVGYARPGGVDIDLPTEGSIPISRGCTASRRIVRSLKNPLACVMQLVPLDSGENSRPPHLLSRFNTASIPSEASVSEVRSELCSVAMEEQTEDSTSSFFDHRRLRHGGKVSSSMSRSRASRVGHEIRARMRRSFPSGSSREVEESFLSYSDDPSFYACDSDASSNSAETEGSSHSMSYTAISESVPSCSLTGLTENKYAVTGWASRFRKPNVPPPHRESNSFGSIFGSGGIDPYNGASVNAHHQARDSAAADVAVGIAAEPRIAAAVPQRDPPVVVISPSASSARVNTARTSHVAASTAAQSAPSASVARLCDGGLQFTADNSSAVQGTDRGSPLSNSIDQRPRVQSVKLLERVGRGTFGDVYRAQDLDSGNIIAVKEIIVPHDFTKDVEKQLAALESEIRVMRRLHHPHVVTYLGAVRENNSLRIFMEFVGGGTVGSKLESVGGLSEEKTRDYTAQLLEGLEYLHVSHILHRDLKGDNLFLTEDDQLKLGDFGQSKELADTLITRSVQGTPSFMSPEMIACSGYSFEADVWSVGCCVIQMLTGKPPFANLDNQMAVMFAIISSKIEDQIPACASEGAKDFIRMCTKTNIKDRWNASQLRRHPWLLGQGAPAAATASAAVTKAAGERREGAGHKPIAAHPPLKTKEPAHPNPHPGKPPRSILLDTAALAKAKGGDDMTKDPSSSSPGGYQYSLEDETGDHEAGGTTSSNLSSSKSETPSSKNAAATRHAGVPFSGSSPLSEGASMESRHRSPMALPEALPSGGRLDRTHESAHRATPGQGDSLVMVGQEGSGGSGARGRRKSPPEPAQRPQRPAHLHKERSPRHRALMTGGAAAVESSSKRRSNPSPVSRALNTPVHNRANLSTSPSKQRADLRPAGSSIYRVSGVANQPSRTTPNKTSSPGKKRQTTAVRATGHALKNDHKA
ncbi:protein kinase, putative [Leishmania donovani]|uniref:Protein kinase domain family protein n=1 Tax=Leishmania donovani TaxID=5661 RepID=A0A3S7X353_LEIDO|nr:protein kinase, putative [Leishmania donovani]AYU80858.1 protein kinase, putative [Leishmania donovani]TPP45631.1 Protein kinase domain family protein [Leishmania donovani]CBZ36084.1 protein kinase, putative [Leishmania donovani]